MLDYPIKPHNTLLDGRFKVQHVVPGVYTWHAQLTLKDGTYKTVKGDLTVVR